jgi:hypothetical protein
MLFFPTRESNINKSVFEILNYIVYKYGCPQPLNIVETVATC